MSSAALDAPRLSREARAAALGLEVLSHLAGLSQRTTGNWTVVISLELCRKADMALRLMAREEPANGD